MAVTFTTVAPAAHERVNFGRDVQAVTFRYNGEVITVNRAGNHNVMMYLSTVNNTVTITNRAGHKVANMAASGLTVETIHSKK